MNTQKDVYSAIVQIIRTGHWLTDSVSRELKEFDISEPQFNVLRILRGRKGNPVSVQEILQDMVQPSSNVTRIVDKLQKRGFVARHICPVNRRKVDITITPKGLRFLQLLDERVHNFHRPLMNNLTAPEARKLTKLIKKLIVNKS